MNQQRGSYSPHLQRKWQNNIASIWRALLLTAFLCAGSYAGETPSPAATDSCDVWYTQIGAWHQVLDSLSGTAYVYHNAAVDGARSGQAFADLKYNRKINGLTRISTDLSISRSSSAGLLLKNKKVSYCFYIEKGPDGDSIRIVRRFDGRITAIAAFTATVADTQRLEIDVTADSLRITAGKIIRCIRKPADLSDELTIGLTCSRGEVRVWRLQAQAASININESFARATVINLGLEKMFKVRSTHTNHTRPTSSP